MQIHASSRVRRRPRGSSGGFVFLSLLMLLIVATIIVASALQQSAMQSRITERQLENYRRHHEMLGVRDYCGSWIGRREVDAKKLSEFSSSGEIAHRLALDDGTVMLFTVQDGQGTVLRNLENVKGQAEQRWLVEVLARLPEGRPELTRRSGPSQISLPGAPDDVIWAIGAGEARIVQALTEARNSRVSNPAELQMALERADVEPLVVQALLQNLVFEPTMWRIIIEVVHPERTARYTILAQKKGNINIMHEWRVLTDEEAERIFGLDSAPER